MDVKKVTSLVLAQWFLFSTSFAARPMAADEEAHLENTAPAILTVTKESTQKDLETSDKSDAKVETLGTENKSDNANVDSEGSSTKENLNELSTKNEEPKVALDEINNVEAVSLEELQQEMQKISKQLSDLQNARVSSSKELNDSLQQLSDQFTKQLENDSKDRKLSADDINKLQEVLAQIKDMHTPEKPKSFFSKALGFFGNGILLPFKLFFNVFRGLGQMVIDGLHFTVAVGVPCLIIYGLVLIRPKLVECYDGLRKHHGGHNSFFARFGLNFKKGVTSENYGDQEMTEVTCDPKDPLDQEEHDNDAKLNQYSTL